MKKVTILVGRFQPFTKGHLKCAEQASAKTGLPTVVCVVDRDESKISNDNPFPVKPLVNKYNKLLKSNNIEEFIAIPLNYIGSIAEALKEKGYEVGAWVCGSDRAESYKGQVNRYMNSDGYDNAPLSDDFKVIEIDRDLNAEDNVSATKVRECLLNNNKEGFVNLVPKKLAPLYDEWKEQVQKVSQLPQPTSKKKSTKKTTNSSYNRRYREILEARVRRLERKLYRLYNEDAFDDELDDMANNIVKRDRPRKSFDDELDDMVKDRLPSKQLKRGAVGHNNKRIEFDTVQDWVDSMAFNWQTSSNNKIAGLKAAINHLKTKILNQSASRILDGDLSFGLGEAADIRDRIAELQNKSAIVANQIMISAMRKKIKELQDELKLYMY